MMRIKLLKKLRDIGVPLLIFLAAGALFLLAARTAAKRTETVTEESRGVGSGYELKELFPGEETREGRMLSECGAFVDYLDRCYAEGDTDAVMSTLNDEAFGRRNGRNIDRDRFAEEMLSLRESHPDSRLKMKDAVMKDPGTESSPDAVIIAELVRVKAGGEEEYLNRAAYPVYIYVYFDGDGHIESCLFSEMETKRH